MPSPSVSHPGPRLNRSGDVFVLDLGAGENRFTLAFLDELLECLAQVQAAPPPRSLVTTGTGKFFSTGLDLDWIAHYPRQARTLVQRLHEVLASLLTCNAFTVAAVQGHAFAGGALLAIAHDAVLMRADRGYFCLPEIDLPVALTDGMTALVTAKLSAAAAAAAMLTGRRFTAQQAVDCGIAHRAVATGQVLTEALDLAARQGAKDPSTLGTMKERLYRSAAYQLRHLGTDLPPTLPAYPNQVG